MNIYSLISIVQSVIFFHARIDSMKSWHIILIICISISIQNTAFLLNGDIDLLVKNILPIPWTICFFSYTLYMDQTPTGFYNMSRRSVCLCCIHLVYSLIFALCEYLAKNFQYLNDFMKLVLVGIFQLSFFILRLIFERAGKLIQNDISHQINGYIQLIPSVNSASTPIVGENEIRAYYILPCHLFQYTFSRVLG